MSEIYKAHYSSPLGPVEITATERGIASILFVKDAVELPTSKSALLEECLEQLDEYFQGRREQFSVAVCQPGTPFQERVWQELSHIPFGRTASYLDIAVNLGDRKAVRAVGGANGHNRVNILVPCHRVIGSNGKLTGYGGEVWRKEWLLKHEQRVYTPTLF